MIAQVLLVSAQVQTKKGTRVLQAVTFEVFSRVESGTASMVRGTRDFWGNYVGLRNVREDNASLRRRVGELEVALQQEHGLASRSRQLEGLLALKTQATMTTLAAQGIAGNPDPTLRTITIDRGSHDGVVADMAVIAPGGIVGRIISPVGRSASRVQLLIDRSAAAGAIVERTRAGGVAVGAEGDPPLRMESVSNLADVKAGDNVVASGGGGIFPEGDPVGRGRPFAPCKGLYRTISVRGWVVFSSREEGRVVRTPPRGAVRDEAEK